MLHASYSPFALFGWEGRSVAVSRPKNTFPLIVDTHESFMKQQTVLRQPNAWN